VTKTAGFTYIETLLAVALIGIAFVPLVGVFLAAAYAQETAESFVTATMLAQEGMEELLAAPPGEVTSAARAAVPGYPGYERQVEVTALGPELREVRVTVFWREGDEDKELQLVTLLLPGLWVK